MPANCGVASVIRAVMDVGAPFMTPGAGTARPIRGIVRGGVRGDRRRGAIYDARCRHGTTSAALFAAVYAMFPANCGVATVVRATQVSPPRLAAASCGVASVVRATQVSPLCLAAVSCCVATVVRATQVSPLRFSGGILLRCVGCSGDTSVAPTFWRRYPAALRRYSGRHKCRPYVGRRVWRSRCLPTR